MKIKLILLPLLCACFAFTLPAPARGGEVTEQVRKSVDEVVKIVADKELKKPEREGERRQRLKAAVGKFFDYEEMAQRSLATHWKARTPAERKEFVQLYETLLENSYSGKIESYNQEKITYLNESVDGEYAEVKSKLTTAKRDEYTLDYRLLKKGGKWLVYDVVIEGVSLVSNYRSQFNKIITNQGYDALVKKLRSKSDEIKAP